MDFLSAVAADGSIQVSSHWLWHKPGLLSALPPCSPATARLLYPLYCLIRGHNRPWLKSTLQCEIKAAVLCKIYVSVSHKCMFLTSGIYVDSGDLCGSLAVRIQCFSFRDHFFSLSVCLSFSHSLSYCLSLSISHCFSPFLSHSVSLSFSVFTVSPLSNYNFLMYTLFTCSNMLMALHAVSLGVSSVVALCATWGILCYCAAAASSCLMARARVPCKAAVVGRDQDCATRRAVPSPPAQCIALGELILSDLSSRHRGHRVWHRLG